MNQVKTQQLSSASAKATADKPRIFTVWSDKLNGRVDPFHYQPEFVRLIDRLKGAKTYKLIDLITDLSGGATPRVTEDFYLSENGIPFLRVQNITEKGISLDGVKFIKPEVHNTQLKRSQLKKDDIVFTITGRIGSASVVPDNFEGNINQHSVRLHLKNEINGIKILPQYIATYFNSEIGRKMSLRDITGGTRPALDYEAIKNLQIPLPPLSTQNKIVEIMAKAYQEKKEKEAEAGKLLKSIDTYVLDKLGIKVSQVSNNISFVVYSDEIQGRRIDPKAYLEQPKEILKAIKKSKYKTKKLLEIISHNIAGEWGEDPLFTEHTDNYVLANVLRNTNFDNKFNLNMDDVAQRLIIKNKFEKVKLQKGDILIEKSGGSPIQPVGRVAIFENDDKDFAFSNFLQCFRLNKNECLPYYLFVYLKTIYNLGYMEYVQNQTTGIKNLIMEEYLSIPAALPPLAVQNKIVEKIKFYYSQAQKLKNEANSNLQKAKEKVEQIILG